MMAILLIPVKSIDNGFSDEDQTDVAKIANTLGFETPLQGVSGWTVYYGYTNGTGIILSCSAESYYTISETPKITQAIIPTK